MVEEFETPESKEFQLQTTYETRHESEMMRIEVPEFSARLEAFGLNRYEFYWPTNVSKDEVVDLIYRAGRSIKASMYGYAYAHAKTWTRREEIKPHETESAVFHLSMMNSLLGSIVIREYLFTELATATDGFHCCVSWVEAFNEGDFVRNQFSISGSYYDLNLTDKWVQEFIKQTADEGLKQHVDPVTAMLQDAFECEGLVLALRKVTDFPD